MASLLGEARTHGLPRGQSAQSRAGPAMAAANSFPPAGQGAPPLHREAKEPALAIKALAREGCLSVPPLRVDAREGRDGRGRPKTEGRIR